MSAPLRYKDVQTYLQTFSDDNPTYDFNGMLHLVLSGVENLRTYAHEGDLVTFAHSISDEQAAFLQRLLDARPESIAEYGQD